MTPLSKRLIERIEKSGAITVAEYMALCLLDPVDGYYPTRDPLGTDGDFITAPEISQMFGELIGIWCVQSWKDLGEPKTINLVELGPGRGVMMNDILRAAQLAPEFLKAVTVHLIEASAALQAVQGQSLMNSPVAVNWIDDLSQLPDGPNLIIGNEFLDCLPIRQLVQNDRFAKAGGWHERLVSSDNGELTFALSPTPISETLQKALPAGHETAKNGELLEINPSSQQILQSLSRLFEKQPGRALFIDYGPDATEFGDSLQALKRHKKISVFAEPGNSDLTARVDFSALVEFGREIGLEASTPVTQREFLSKLGLEIRAVALSRNKPEAKAKILRQLHRLTDSEEMGELFKAICFQSKGLGIPLGFRDIT